MKNQKGITLVALVVTIILLIIIGGVTFSIVLSQNGLINKAQEAKNTQLNATAEENAFFSDIDSYINDQLSGISGE